MVGSSENFEPALWVEVALLAPQSKDKRLRAGGSRDRTEVARIQVELPIIAGEKYLAWFKGERSIVRSDGLPSWVSAQVNLPIEVLEAATKLHRTAGLRMNNLELWAASFAHRLPSI
jgi:hypothetical protein